MWEVSDDTNMINTDNSCSVCVCLSVQLLVTGSCFNMRFYCTVICCQSSKRYCVTVHVEADVKRTLGLGFLFEVSIMQGWSDELIGRKLF